MNKAKKIFTRMCLNNWGGINHKVLVFNEYVNLFSGKSGSGKSTVMDAIQVILYGSFSPSFLNKAADDAKNKRSVLSYLRGEQKDGTANREGQDFCSTIALEIEDTGSHTYTCIGIAFEVRKNDTEIKKYMYFSHVGKMPEQEYCTEDGFPYSNRDIKKLIEERSMSSENRGKVDVNRIYPSKEAYLNSLYDVIMGYIDGARFVTMEKSAIALKMTNGTGQFIRDYMFPKNEGDIIGKISEQLGAYRNIKEKIDDLEKRIHMLSEIEVADRNLQEVKIETLHLEALLKCVEIKGLQAIIESYINDKENVESELQRLKQEKNRIDDTKQKIEDELMEAKVELAKSDVKKEEERLQAIQLLCETLTGQSNEWRRIVQGLHAWEADEIVTDYVSNPLLNAMERFTKGKVTQEDCENLHKRLEETKENIEEELENVREQKRDINVALTEKKKLVDDMKNNRKSYSDRLKQARGALERRLSDAYGRTIKVHILADLFDVEEETWKNAIEGRLGRTKLSLITEPQYAHDAAVYFREMKQYEEVDLINSAAIVASEPKVLANSLYEAVATKETYVDICLQRYLGHIIKCQSVEELEQVRDGVTPDCYSYSNFIFRHLRKKDYTTNACIGCKVSKVKLKEYEEEVEKLTKEYLEIVNIENHLKETNRFEHLDRDYDYVVKISKAQQELEKALGEKQKQEQVIHLLKEGEYKQLEEKVKQLEEAFGIIKRQGKELEDNCIAKEKWIAGREKEIESKKNELDEKSMGYVENEDMEQEAEKELRQSSVTNIKSKINSQMQRLGEKRDELNEVLYMERNKFNKAYPNYGFSGGEKTNEKYSQVLNQCRNDFEPKYQAEFEEQCNTIYKSLRENVIATIHGDIKAANRHKNEINRLLRDTNFSDSIYQIKIEAAQNANGQFYDMLMAKELDSKNVDALVCDGQLTLGEDEFYRKYEDKIKLLIDKFMPPKAGEDRNSEQRQREMEQYADYRNYLSFSMYEQVTDEQGNVIRENFVDEMAGRDSGGEGQNPKYVALLAGFAMLYMQQSVRESKIRLVLLDEAFSKMDQERSEVCLNYARKMDLQLIVCVPDERLQSLIRNVDCVYGFRRSNDNQISMMHIDKGRYLKLMENGEEDELEEENEEAEGHNTDSWTMADK